MAQSQSLTFGNTSTAAGALSYLGDFRGAKINNVLPGEHHTSRFSKCLMSLSYPEMRTRKSNIEIVEPETCQWLLNHDAFTKWTRSSNGLLWIQGKAGAGKSVVMRFIYEQAQIFTTNALHIKLSFFFNARGATLERSALGMFRSLVYQLYKQDEDARKKIQDTFDNHSEDGAVGIKWDWTDAELEKYFFEQIVEISKSRKITIFVDALDEAGELVADKVANYLSVLNQKVRDMSGMARICFSSRHHPIVSVNVAEDCIITVEKSNMEGIRLYVHKKLETLRRGHITDDLEIALITKASGVFQWVKLVLSAVARADIEGESTDEIRRIVEEPSGELEEMYHRIFENLKAKHRGNTKALFQWVCLSARPLTIHELQHAMAISDNPSLALVFEFEWTGKIDNYDGSLKKQITEWSGGLIEVINKGSNDAFVQVTHQTVRDFLLGHETSPKYRVWLNENDFRGISHDRLTRACIDYLRSEEVQTALNKLPPAHPDQVNSWKVSIAKNLPLLRYATTACFWHASKAEIYGYSQADLPKQLGFDSTRQRLWRSGRKVMGQTFEVWKAAACLYAPREFFGAIPSKGCTILHMAAMANLDSVVKDLMESRIEMNKTDDHGRQAIHYAARGGAEKVVETLLTYSTFLGQSPINVQDKGSVTPLQLAARNGHHGIIELLLRKKAKIKLHNSRTQRTLKIIKDGNIREITKLLLEDAAEFNMKSLHSAVLQGDLLVSTLLVDEGANVNAQTTDGTILISAARSGYRDMVEMLLERGADVNVQGIDGTVLISAAQSGHQAIIELILERGADVNSQGRHGTALIIATRQGNKAIVQTLLRKGANIHDESRTLANALVEAADMNNTMMVEVFLTAGARIDQFLSTIHSIYSASRGASKGTSICTVVLHVAAKLGRLDLIDQIVASFDEPDDDELQPSDTSGTNVEDLMSLIDHRVSKVNFGGSWNSQQALQAAAGGGHLEIVQKLISMGADINGMPAEDNGRTALQAAAEGGYLEVVERLLAAKADVNAAASDSNGRTALQAAAGAGHLTIVERLLTGKADVNAAGSCWNGRTSLQAAAGGGHLTIVERLLAAKADVNAAASDRDGRTALQAAAGGGHLLVVEQLLTGKANVNAVGSCWNGRTSLQAAAGGGHLTIVERLLAAKANVNVAALDGDGGTALQAAAGGGHLTVVERLLTGKADVNAAGSCWNGRTSLQAAAGGGHLTVVERLLAASANVNAVASKGDGGTALQAAAGGGHLLVVERLLAAKANVNIAASDWDGRTALQAAAGGGHLLVVERLLVAKADVNAAGSFSHGRTALQAAAGGGHLLVVEQLLAAKADVNAAGSFSVGRTALQAAAEGGHFAVVERLLAAKADVNAAGSCWNGRTALQAAAGGGHLIVVEQLLVAKANVNAAASDRDGGTALQAAAGGGHLLVVERLLAAKANINVAASFGHGRIALQVASAWVAFSN